jgi:chemotaxis protein MotB
MSLRRKTDDGTLFAGSLGIAEWGDPGPGEVKIGKHAPAKRTRKTNKVDEYAESPFHEDGEKDRYLITYADLITLLLGLFILLYTSSNLDLQKYQNVMKAMGNVFGGSTEVPNVVKEVSPKIVTPLDNLKNNILNFINDNNYSKSIRLEENSRGITIHILEDIVFPSGSADLKKGSQIVLSQIANVIKELPNDIRIEGHTDNIPISTKQFPSNWHLSVARALNTAYFLIKDEGLDPEKISIVGSSEYKPIESNESESGRASNRRVDIVIIK